MPESPIKVGSAIARPGALSTGFFEAFPLPTGGMEKLPVMIAQGDPQGPVMWLTTGIHGPEHTGIAVLHDLITPDLAARLNGTLIAIPALSPAGLRTTARQPYYHDGDPNRIFPGSTPPDDDASPSALEETYTRLFEAIMQTEPVCLLDLHNAWIGSLPFAFRDPVFFTTRTRGSKQGLTRQQAFHLSDQISGLLDALGLTVINEFVADEYIKTNLHRSVTGSLVNQGGIPAATLELGSVWHIDPGVVSATSMGLRNVMRHFGLLTDDRESIREVPVIDAGFPVRRISAPHMPQAGIAHILLRPGEPFEPGQPLVRITDIFGQSIGPEDGLLRAEHQGFVLSWRHGIVRYQGDIIMSLAIRDDSDLVVPYPA